MRSSKSRSRNKQRNRSVGNIVNRVFDSSGPESKVRGTPQQIIDKYTQLARDAQLSGDRVATENFYQHAEHYTRMLAEAQREQDQRREQHESQQGGNGGQGNGQNNGGQNNGGQNNGNQGNQGGDNRQGGNQNHQGGDNRQGAQNHQQPRQDEAAQDDQPQSQPQSQPQPQQQGDQPAPSRPRNRRRKPEADSAPADSNTGGPGGSDDVIDFGGEGDSGLVETPESKPESKPRKPRSRKPKTSPVDEDDKAPADKDATAAE